MLLIILAHGTKADYALKAGSIVTINNTTGDIALSTENQLLQCGEPINTGTIEYLDCGFGSVPDNNGGCLVDLNEPFEIDYGLDTAQSCEGLNGTAEWQGSHPIGFGTGDYSYPIFNGISQSTDFTLSCTPQSTIHTFKQIIHRGVVDIRNMLDSGKVLAAMSKTMWRIDATENNVERIPLKHTVDVNKLDSIEFMVRQLGNDINIVPTTDRANINIEESEKLLIESVTTYMVITGDLPPEQINQIPRSKAKGICDSLNPDNKASINIVFNKEEKGCYVDLEQPAFLVWYLLEKSYEVKK